MKSLSNADNETFPGRFRFDTAENELSEAELLMILAILTSSRRRNMVSILRFLAEQAKDAGAGAALAAAVAAATAQAAKAEAAMRALDAEEKKAQEFPAANATDFHPTTANIELRMSGNVSVGNCL